jgi:hypothetical protein
MSRTLELLYLLQDVANLLDAGVNNSNQQRNECYQYSYSAKHDSYLPTCLAICNICKNLAS